jgi:molybdopterin-guanine dinucleotide biosynthesis protein B
VRGEPLTPEDGSILAVAADHATDAAGRPFFDLDDVSGIADFIEARLGLKGKDV